MQPIEQPPQPQIPPDERMRLLLELAKKLQGAGQQQPVLQPGQAMPAPRG